MQEITLTHFFPLAARAGSLKVRLSWAVIRELLLGRDVAGVPRASALRNANGILLLLFHPQRLPRNKTFNVNVILGAGFVTYDYLV